MSNRLRITVAGICLLTFVLFIWWRASSPEAVQQAPAFTPPPTTPTPAATSPVALPSATPAPKTKDEQMSALLTMTSQTPISFFGKVIDQQGAPVAGVKVTATAEVVRRFMEENWVRQSTLSDSRGLFQFVGLHGQSLSVFLEKAGYQYKSNNLVYEYSIHSPEKERHRPDPAAPVVFTMAKLKGAEPLIHYRVRIDAPVNGSPTSFDLLTGKKLPSGGDVVVKVDRQPEHIQRGQRFDWKATIEVPGGGIAELNDAYPTEAPADGYEPQFTIEMPAAGKEWEDSATHSFYLKLRDGKFYARLRLEITADYEPPPTGVTLEAWVNPSGSRNLEYDPAKQASAR